MLPMLVVNAATTVIALPDFARMSIVGNTNAPVVDTLEAPANVVKICVRLVLVSSVYVHES